LLLEREDRRVPHWEAAEHSPDGDPELDAVNSIAEGVERGNLAHQPSSSGAILLLSSHHR